MYDTIGEISTSPVFVRLRKKLTIIRASLRCEKDWGNIIICGVFVEKFIHFRSE